MKFLNKLERKFGKYAIKNISLVLIICYAMGYMLSLLSPPSIYFLYLNPYLILRGQIWRLVTWILIPPSSLSFFTLLMLYFYYSIGTNLEHTWGTFRYNVFLISGMLFTIIGSFLLLGYFYLTNQGILNGVSGETYFGMVQGSYVFGGFSTYYINMSIFLAYAMTFPEMQVLLFFMIPIKVKILGIIYAILLGYEFIMTGTAGKFIIGASLLNVVVFFLITRNYRRINPKEIHRKRVYRQQVHMSKAVTKHKCAICGRTEQDGEHLEFRFCSKCNGNYEYCQEHLFTHEHIR